MDSNVLNTGTEIPAVIGCFPGTRNYIIAGTSPWSIGIRIGDHGRGIAVVSCRCGPGICRYGGHIAIDGYINGTGNHRGCYVMNRDCLHA